MGRFSVLVVAPFAYAISAAALALAPSIGGISLGSDQAAVIAALGQPRHVVRTGDALDPLLEYEGISIWLWDGRGVAQVRSTDAKYCLTVGVCPGTSVADLRAKLGTPLGRPDIGEGRNDYAVEAEACWLEATIASSVVTALELKCQP
jgi:hypothetical protein